MVVAYLRGLLKPQSSYGLRSSLAESAIFEAMAAQIAVDSFEVTMAMDAAMLPVLTANGVRSTMRSIGKRASRCSELRMVDIYRLESAIEDKITRGRNKNTPSLYQLYHLAEKQGIFAALRAQDPVTEEEQ